MRIWRITSLNVLRGLEDSTEHVLSKGNLVDRYRLVHVGCTTPSQKNDGQAFLASRSVLGERHHWAQSCELEGGSVA